ncbi:YwaF family protein [Phytoactinopolyspora halotolerans]|uniref:TIGR02206 family membrane protein n=1 Tax=Phytoactinopolyspora halotolerans TaxID=1981512 RepID=A0A6L9SJW3_9ACTN|nr:TIGR02206 family membrane protein [Phytoactinopolyspora halotolerans]NEE04360.1 TIGR02206 family membrane protein [Phytoactinopolyspora halotolerans]
MHDAATRAASGVFTPYGASHLVVLAVLVVVGWWLLRRGRALRGTSAADRLSMTFAVVFLALTLPLQIWFLTPPRFNIEGALPIQLSDLAWLTAVYALMTRARWASALTYYWGLTLTTQAIFTPSLDRDFPALPFFLFWAMHGLTVVAAIYLTWGLGITPDWRRYRVTLAATALWAVSVFTFNSIVDTNYGFLNAKPDTASLLDWFGPWPWYLLVETVIVASVWALITVPWVLRAKASSRGGTGA